MKKYGLKFTQLYKYAPTLVEDCPRLIFFMGVSDLVVNECRFAILIQSIHIFCHIVHAEQAEEQKLKQGNREVNNARKNDGNSLKGKFKNHGRPRFKKMFSNQDFLRTPRFNKDKVSNPKP